MKIIVPLLLIFCLIGSYTGGNLSVVTNSYEKDTSVSVLDTHVESLVFSQVKTSDSSEYTSVVLTEATSYLQQPGMPKLPIVTKVFLFPFGTRIKNIDVSFSGLDQITLSKQVEPASAPMITSTLYQTPNYLPDTSEYNAFQHYPEVTYTYSTAAGLYDGSRVTLAIIHLHPVTYYPQSNTLLTAKEAEIMVEFQPSETKYELADEYDLLILTPQIFADDLQPLVDYKNSHDIPTILTTIETIPEVGINTQESIKYYIKDAIETWGITNVLLVGAGLEGSELFPVRYAYVPSGGYEDSFPSDLYYADIYDAEGNFSSWDADGDGLYAELMDDTYEDIDAVDIFPDVYLGRLPCNNRFEVKTMVNKIIDAHEENTVTNTIVQIGGDTFPGDPEDINEGEYTNTKVMENLPGYNAIQLWASTDTLTKTNIIKETNKGVDFVDFSGHGSYISWATHPPGDEANWIPDTTFYSPYTGFLYIDANWLFNLQKHPVFIYNACSCSKFTESEFCLSWQSIRRPWGGGIASFGASGIGYGDYGSNESKRLFGYMEIQLLKEMHLTRNIGESWGNALTSYAQSFELNDGDYKTLLELELFGDPTLTI